jgi:hypothetical protein
MVLNLKKMIRGGQKSDKKGPKSLSIEAGSSLSPLLIWNLTLEKKKKPL